MNRPIIVFSDDVYFFDSVEAAECFIEPPDIVDCVIYDCEGVRLSANVEQQRRLFLIRDVVVISDDVPRSQDAEDLGLRIKEYLEWIGHPIDDDAPDSLDVLIPHIRKWARCG